MQQQNLNENQAWACIPVRNMHKCIKKYREIDGEIERTRRVLSVRKQQQQHKQNIIFDHCDTVTTQIVGFFIVVFENPNSI